MKPSRAPRRGAPPFGQGRHAWIRWHVLGLRLHLEESAIAGARRRVHRNRIAAAVVLALGATALVLWSLS